MAKTSIDDFSVYPMPVVIVGSMVDGRPNFMTAAWLAKLNYEPPIVGVSIGHPQHTARGIQQNGQFSINVPSVDQAILADYCGLVHGFDEDKAAHLEVVKGSLDSAPMVGECPLSAECRVIQTVKLPRDYLFIAEVVGTYAAEEVLTDGKVDPVKLRPFTLTMPDNSYWALGERVGEAWSIGRALKRQKD